MGAEARNKYDDEEQLTKRVEQAAAAQVDALASTFNQAAQAAVEKASAAQRASEQAAERAAEHATAASSAQATSMPNPEEVQKLVEQHVRAALENHKITSQDEGTEASVAPVATPRSAASVVMRLLSGGVAALTALCVVLAI